MRWVSRFVVPLIGIAVLWGCDKPKDSAAPVTTTTVRTGPTTVPSTAPTTAPASSPTASSLSIDGKVVNFPPAHVEVLEGQPNLKLVLYSGDPRDALAANYSGNRYYLEFKLTIDDPDELSGAEYIARAASMERHDTPFGIFLEGDKKQLQPYNIQVAFYREGKNLRVTFFQESRFLQFDTHNEAVAPQLVRITGALVAEMGDLPKRKKAEPAK